MCGCLSFQRSSRVMFDRAIASRGVLSPACSTSESAVSDCVSPIDGLVQHCPSWVTRSLSPGERGAIGCGGWIAKWEAEHAVIRRRRRGRSLIGLKYEDSHLSGETLSTTKERVRGASRTLAS